MTYELVQPGTTWRVAMASMGARGAAFMNGQDVVMTPTTSRHLSRAGDRPMPAGEWAISKRWRFARLWLAILALPLAGWPFYQLMKHQSVSLVGIMLGTLAVGALFFGLQGKRQITVVDADGIRRIGDEYWRLNWSQITDAKAVEGVLLVNPTDEAAGLALGTRLFAPIARKDEGEMQRVIDHYRQHAVKDR